MNEDMKIGAILALEGVKRRINDSKSRIEKKRI